MRGDPFESGEPLLEAADVGVHVLDVIAAVGAFAGARIERDMQEAGVVGERRIGGTAVADRDPSAATTGFRMRLKGAFEIRQHVIQRRAMPSRAISTGA